MAWSRLQPRYFSHLCKMLWTILKDLEISGSDVCWAAVWEELSNRGRYEGSQWPGRDYNPGTSHIYVKCCGRLI